MAAVDHEGELASRNGAPIHGLYVVDAAGYSPGTEQGDRNPWGEPPMSLADAVRDHVREHRRGMVADLVFAVVWVIVVSLFFEVVDGPQWAYYLLMFSGVVAYFGFVWSLGLAREARTD